MDLRDSWRPDRVEPSCMNCSCALCGVRLSVGLWSTVAVRVPGEGVRVGQHMDDNDCAAFIV